MSKKGSQKCKQKSKNSQNNDTVLVKSIEQMTLEEVEKKNTIKKAIHQNGQYFTTNIPLKKNVFDLIQKKPSLILEPSCGQGDLIEYVTNKLRNVKFESYEIDKSIHLLPSIDKNIANVRHTDFLELEITKTFKTIIGNPPYVKTKTGNLYLKFIDTCFELLENEGELIFIVPSDFIKITSSAKIINKMMKAGTFTDIIFPNNENLFKNASIDVMIFRYCKDSTLPKKVNVKVGINEEQKEEEKFLINTNGILTFSDTESTNQKTFLDYFDIYVGIVSGKESVFKNEKYGNVKILNNKNKMDDYILIEKLPSDNTKLVKYLEGKKTELKERKIKKFTDENWFEWGALRNYKTIKNKIKSDSNLECLYVKNITRDKEVCFKNKIQLFGGGLIIMIPKKNINLDDVASHINSSEFRNNYMYSGRFKIGHKQLCNCLFNIPTNFI